jgi:hypothetical protein
MMLRVVASLLYSQGSHRPSEQYTPPSLSSIIHQVRPDMAPQILILGAAGYIGGK